MKAAVYTSYGPPSVIKVRTVPAPEPKDDELLVKVHMTSLNRTDCGTRSAQYFVSRFFTGLIKPRITIGGSEFAGEVVKVGSRVTNFKVGDRVFGFEDIKAGGHAEFVAIADGGSVAKIPDGIPYAVAAAAGEGATYAISSIRAARVQSGQNVLVYGASGGIGSAAVQVLKAMNVTVTAVCNTANVKRVKTLGADYVIDYEKTDFTKSEERYDLVMDAVGKRSYAICKPLLKAGGIYCSTELGDNMQNPFLALWFGLTGKRSVIFPIPKINQETMQYIASLLKAGSYKPLIDRTYSMDQIVEAAEYVETGQKVGNVLITIVNNAKKA